MPETFRPKKIEQRLFPLLTSFIIAIDGCTQKLPQEVPVQPVPIITFGKPEGVLPQEVPPQPLPAVAPEKPAEPIPPFSESEFRERVKKSWVIKEVLGLSPEELATEDLTPQELPELIEELLHSFSYNTIVGEFVPVFNESLFRDGASLRIKRGTLAADKKDRAIQTIMSGLSEGKKGAGISSRIVQSDDGATTLCRFVDTFDSSVRGSSSPINTKLYKNESGVFRCIEQSIVEFPSTPQSAVTDPCQII